MLGGLKVVGLAARLFSLTILHKIIHMPIYGGSCTSMPNERVSNRRGIVYQRLANSLNRGCLRPSIQNYKLSRPSKYIFSSTKLITSVLFPAPRSSVLAAHQFTSLPYRSSISLQTHQSINLSTHQPQPYRPPFPSIRPPHDQSHEMSYIDGLIAEIVLLCYRIIVYGSFIIMWAYFVLFGICVIGAVIAIPVYIIMGPREPVEEHQNRSDVGENGDCENGRQDLTESDGQYITVEVIESFDEDARTVVGEESGKSSVDLNEKANFEEHYPLLRDDGQHTIKEDRVSFDEDARTISGEEEDISSIDLSEKGYLEEPFGIIKDDDQHTVEEDKKRLDIHGRQSLEEDNDKGYLEER